jgi:ComF family protein
VALYDDAWRSLIQNYTYRARVQRAPLLGRLLWRALIENWRLEEIDGIIPVPLHPRRLRSRGYNQAELLLRRWPDHALSSGLAGGRDWIDGGALRRVRATPSQTGLDRQQRRDNLKAAFQVADPARVRDRRLLLVDDVFTTGATIEACARTLLDAGAAAVHVLTLARVVKRPPCRSTPISGDGNPATMENMRHRSFKPVETNCKTPVRAQKKGSIRAFANGIVFMIQVADAFRDNESCSTKHEKFGAKFSVYPEPVALTNQRNNVYV